MSHPTITFVLGFLFSSVAIGQDDPTPEEVRAGLMSKLPQSRAIAAYDAGRLGYSELAPDLVAALIADNERSDVTDDRSQRGRAILLDAMIRLDVSATPASICAKLYPSCLAPALILVADQETPTLRALQAIQQEAKASSEVHWVATALLAHHGDPSAVRYLADAILVTIQISVRAKGDTSESYTLYGHGRGGWATSHRHVPPRVDYLLTEMSNGISSDGYTVFVPGSLRLQYKRLEASSHGRGVTQFTNHHAAIFAAKILHTIFESPANNRLVVTPHIAIDWTDGESFVAEAREAEATARANWASLLTRIQDSLTDDDPVVTSPLRLNFRVTDLREDPSESLPDLAPLE